jgi:hypothetical protein
MEEEFCTVENKMLKDWKEEMLWQLRTRKTAVEITGSQEHGKNAEHLHHKS